MIMGGYATETLIFGEVTTGPSNDLQKATALAKALVTEYGMDEKLGPRTFGQREEMIFLGREIHERRDFSEHTAQIIDEQTTILLKNAFTRAKETIMQHKEKLEQIVKVLLEKETIEREEFAAIMENKPHNATEHKKDKTV
jgi:cell division protease FtsH